MAEELNGKVKFVLVDVDKSQDAAEQYEVSAMPTLVLVKDGAEADRLRGADAVKLREMIDSAL